MTEEELLAVIEAYETTKKQAREARDTAIVRAAAEGMRQKDIVRIARLTRERVRQIVREGGG